MKIKEIYNIVENLFIILNRTNHIKCYIPVHTKFYHSALGTVISEAAVIGDYCQISQNVTIGVSGGHAPEIQHHVVIRCNAVIIGDITVGHHSYIAAGSVVRHNVPPYSMVAGNPAQVVRKIKPEEYKEWRMKL
jgi:serine acetyltransferase